jgi:hypothetical protein
VCGFKRTERLTGGELWGLSAAVPVVPVVCENYHRLFDGKRMFERGTLKIKSESTC